MPAPSPAAREPRAAPWRTGPARGGAVVRPRPAFRPVERPERSTGAWSCRVVPIAAAALGARQPGERIDGSAGVGIGVEAEMPAGADAPPIAGQQRVAKELGPHRQPVEAP